MINLRDIVLRIRALVAPRRTERELDEELAFHIERETHKHIAAGLGPADARARALASFGPLPLAADRCRDARGIGVVDDLRRDVFYAFRTFRRAPLAAFTIVATVALGLGLVTAVFAVYAIFMLRVDAVRNPGELFAVTMERSMRLHPDSGGPFTRLDYDAMRRDTSVFTDAVAMVDVPARVEDRFMRGTVVTGNFFQVLGVQATLGRPLLPEDDERGAGRPVIVLSDAGWRKLFRGDRAAIGRRVMLKGARYEIVGVMPDGFRGLGITPPDFWAPLALAWHFRDDAPGRADEIGVRIVGRLKPGLSPEAASSALGAWASGRTEFNRLPGRLLEVSLTPSQGTISAEDGEGLLTFSPLFFAFGLILMIGCANVANLLLARGVSRQQEIGVRLSLGASRPRVIRQLLTESLLLALAAAACSLVVSRLFLEGALRAAMSSMPPEFAQLVSALNLAAPGSDWRMLVFVVAGAIVSTAFFGLAPALHATRLDLVPTMRGEVIRNARPRRARHALIAVQVGVSALFLISAVIFLRGAFAAASRDPGIRTIDTLMVNLDFESRRSDVLQALRADPSVALVAASSEAPREVIVTPVSPNTPNIPSTPSTPSGPGRPSRLLIHEMAVSSGYFDVLGFNLVSGRAFTEVERTTEAGVAVVSETVARQLWPNGGGVGQVVRLEAPPPESADVPSPSSSASPSASPSRTLTVVGVIRDPRDASGFITRDTIPGVYLPTGLETPETRLMLRVRGNPDEVRLALAGKLPGLDPGFGVLSLRTTTHAQAYMLRIASGLTIVLGGLALMLTVSGLFSVLSYLVEQQAKEIGVRIALGAATSNVVRLVLAQSLGPVAIGLAAGGGLAVAVAIVLTSTAAAAEIGGVVDVLDPVAYVASTLVIATACLLAVSVPTLSAARIDPIATLRKD
jgi:predicted permease